MRATIDSAGRVVIPKELRESAGLQPGPVEVRVRDGRVEIEPVPVEMTWTEQDGLLVAVPSRPMPPLTAEMVRDALERVRR